MGKAGKALKQVLETYHITQNQLAVTMGVGRSTIHYWFNDIRDPSAESVTEIVDALQQLDSGAAREFVRLYLGDRLFNDIDHLRNTES